MEYEHRNNEPESIHKTERVYVPSWVIRFGIFLLWLGGKASDNGVIDGSIVRIPPVQLFLS